MRTKCLLCIKFEYRSRTPLHISINDRFVAVTQFRLFWFASLSNRQNEHHLPLLFTLHDLRMAHMRERVLCASPSSSLTKTICPKTAFIRASLKIVEGAASSLLYVQRLKPFGDDDHAITIVFQWPSRRRRQIRIDF